MADRGADTGLRLQLDNAMFFEFAPVDGESRSERMRAAGSAMSRKASTTLSW